MRKLDLNESLSSDWTFMKRQSTSSSQNNWKRVDQLSPLHWLKFIRFFLLIIIFSWKIAGTQPMPTFGKAAKIAFPLPASRIPLCPGRSTPGLAILWELHGQVSTTYNDKILTLFQKQGSSIFAASTDLGSTDAAACLRLPLSCPQESYKSPATASGLKKIAVKKAS